MSILIISVLDDLHARAVAWNLNNVGIETHIVDVMNFPSASQLSIKPFFHGEAPYNLPIRNQKKEIVNLKEVTAVWCRRLLTGARYFDYSKIHPDDLNNVVTEVHAFIGNLWSIVREEMPNVTSWVNSFESAKKAESKALQLRIAHAVGLLVPDTLMSNHADDVQDFFAKHNGKIIVKPFFPKTWMKDGVLYHQPIMQISAMHLENVGAIQICPGIYQRKIEKKYELRVVVLGDVILCAQLHSQESCHSMMDWRMDAYKRTMRIEPYELGEKIKQKIFSFMHKMGLRFGSIDLIVTPEDDVVFLEVNEQGQFLFLEAQCPDMKIFDAMCDFLASEAGMKQSGPWPTLSDYLASEDGLLLAEMQSQARQMPSTIRYVF